MGMARVRAIMMKVCFWVVLCVVLVVRRVESSVEIEALMEIKSTLDPTGKILHSWVAEGNPCGGGFEGVACNENGKVANVSLQSKNLSGFLSPSFAKLRCLSGLYLHFNNLRGEIPKEVSNLTELADLYLNVNALSGSIPPELASMSNLQVLQLCCNQLIGSIPSKLGSLKKLGVLALQHNQLAGAIPSSLGSIVSLNTLDLSFNNLTGAIPQTLASLRQLKVLNLGSNSLSGSVPQGIEYLHNDLAEPIVHQNISAANILLDQHFSPHLSDCALQRLFADDIVFSILKTSAAMGYLAPEYARVGRLTVQSDIYAFGKILLQLLTGATKDISPDNPSTSSAHRSVKTLVESGKIKEFMDPRLDGKYSVLEATNLAEIALACTSELAIERPPMDTVIRRFETGINQETQT